MTMTLDTSAVIVHGHFRAPFMCLATNILPRCCIVLMVLVSVSWYTTPKAVTTIEANLLTNKELPPCSNI